MEKRHQGEKLRADSRAKLPAQMQPRDATFELSDESKKLLQQTVERNIQTVSEKVDE